MAQASGATALNVLASPMLDRNGPPIMKRVAALGLPGHLSMARKGRVRWLCRLRVTLHSVVRPCCAICWELFARHEACRSADQVRAGDQPQDGQSTGRCGARDLGSRPSPVWVALSERSNSARPPSTVSINRPCGSAQLRARTIWPDQVARISICRPRSVRPARRSARGFSGGLARHGCHIARSRLSSRCRSVS
jgi:hypothetical protein